MEEKKSEWEEDSDEEFVPNVGWEDEVDPEDLEKDKKESYRKPFTFFPEVTKSVFEKQTEKGILYSPNRTTIISLEKDDYKERRHKDKKLDKRPPQDHKVDFRVVYDEFANKQKKEKAPLSPTTSETYMWFLHNIEENIEVIPKDRHKRKPTKHHKKFDKKKAKVEAKELLEKYPLDKIKKQDKWQSRYEKRKEKPQWKKKDMPWLSENK